MQVNEEVYGAKANWAKIFTNAEVNKFVENVSPLQAVFPTSSGWNSELIYAFQSGKLTLNRPVDDSIAMLGVDNGSWLTDRKWVAVGKNSTTGVYFSDKFVSKMKKKNVNPVAFSELSSYSATNDNIQTTSPYTSFWGYDQTYNTNSGNLKGKLYTYINIKNTYYVIFVRVTDAKVETITYKDSYNIDTFDLYTYFKYVDKEGKHYYEKYPVVLAVYLLPVYDYKALTSGSYRGTSEQTAKPVVMNSFEDAFYPYDDSGKPLQILTYQQSAWALRPSGFTAAKPFSDPTGTPLHTNISHSPIVLAGHHSVWLSTNQTNNYMYQEYTNINWRAYLDGTVWRIVKWLHIVTKENAEILYNEYMKQAAYLGMFFTDSWDYATKAQTWDYDRCCCGIIDNNGVTHGEYSVGEKNREQKQWNWESFEDNNYKPSVKPDAPDKEQSSDPYNFTGGNPDGLRMGNYYALTADQLASLQDWISKISNPSGSFHDPGAQNPSENSYDPEALAYAIERMFSGVYPVDCILNVMYFPFALDISPFETYIKLGNTVTSEVTNWFGNDTIPAVRATPVYKYSGHTQYMVINTPPFLVEEYFGDFRDYQPYTTMELQVPWHSTVSLDPGQWTRHELSTKMVIDLVTGASTTYIMRDGIPVLSVDGQVGATINYNVRNLGDFTSSTIATSQQLAVQRLNNERATINAVTSTVQGLTVAGLGIASGNLAVATNGVSNAVGSFANGVNTLETGKEIVKNLEFNLNHAPSGSTCVSSQSPAVSHYATNELRLVIKRPHILPGYNSQIYGHTVGFACMLNDVVANFSGFTVFSGVDLSGIDATEQEKQLINERMQSGVII